MNQSLAYILDLESTSAQAGSKISGTIQRLIPPHMQHNAIESSAKVSETADNSKNEGYTLTLLLQCFERSHITMHTEEGNFEFSDSRLICERRQERTTPPVGVKEHFEINIPWDCPSSFRLTWAGRQIPITTSRGSIEYRISLLCVPKEQASNQGYQPQKWMPQVSFQVLPPTFSDIVWDTTPLLEVATELMTSRWCGFIEEKTYGWACNNLSNPLQLQWKPGMEVTLTFKDIPFGDCENGQIQIVLQEYWTWTAKRQQVSHIFRHTLIDRPCSSKSPQSFTFSLPPRSKLCASYDGTLLSCSHMLTIGGYASDKSSPIAAATIPVKIYA